MKPLAAFLLALAAFAACAQGAYRWVGKDGKVHYSDEPPPPAETQKVEQKRLNASVVDSGGTLSYETREAARNFPVTLYVSPDCGTACADGRSFLRKRGIPFAEKSLQGPEDAEVYRKAAGTTDIAVPTLLVGGKAHKGFEAIGWNGLLDGAGYPSGK